jgi:16S rRNA (guanine1207-N2)-methyltransferase
MLTSNINQLLYRNINELAASTPLFVNIEADGFFSDYMQLYPQAKLTCFHTNFAQHNVCKALSNKQLSSHFSAQYSLQDSAQDRHDLIIISFPKSKAELAFTLAMLANTATEDALVVIVGDNKSGIKSVEKLSKNYLNYCNKSDAARHCLLYIGKFKSAIAEFQLEQWFKYYDICQAGVTLKVAALPGVFSQNKLDLGSALLLDNLPENITGQVLDFGCGAGVIAAFIAKQNSKVQIHLADVSALALESARKTLLINDLVGDVIATDSLSHINGMYDLVISNPPFHQGLKTNYAATEQFLSKIKKYLSAKGTVTIVANSFLKYPPIMEQEIGKTQTVCSKNGFSIYFSTQQNK